MPKILFVDENWAIFVGGRGGDVDRKKLIEWEGVGMNIYELGIPIYI